jgi:hypothetical protein
MPYKSIIVTEQKYPQSEKPFTVEAIPLYGDERVSRNFATRVVAETYASKLKGVLTGSPYVSYPSPFSDSNEVASFLAYTSFYDFAKYMIAESRASASVAKKQRHLLEQLRKAGFLKVKVIDLKLKYAENALNWLASKGNNGKPASFSKVKACYTVLRKVTRVAYENELISTDIFHQLEMPKVEKRQAPLKTFSATVCRVVTGSSPVAVEGTYNHKDSQI